MKDIKVFVDTGADMPKELVDKYNLGIINFLCTFDEKSYIAGEELSNQEFYEKLKESSEIPKTSQTPPGVMYDILFEASKEYKNIVYFVLSSKASGQYNNALNNAKDIMEENPDVKIYVVDSMSFSAYIGEMTVKFCELAENGIPIEEAIEKAKTVLDKYETLLLVDSLKYLEKGGRIKKTSAIVGELLDIKPVLGIRDGLIEPTDKLRGKKRVIKKLVGLISEHPDFDSDKKEFIIVESGRAAGDEAMEELSEEFGDYTLKRRYEFGPIVGTHIGDGCVAILFRKKGYID